MPTKLADNPYSSQQLPVDDLPRSASCTTPADLTRSTSPRPDSVGDLPVSVQFHHAMAVSISSPVLIGTQVPTWLSIPISGAKRYLNSSEFGSIVPGMYRSSFILLASDLGTDIDDDPGFSNSSFAAGTPSSLCSRIYHGQLFSNSKQFFASASSPFPDLVQVPLCPGISKPWTPSSIFSPLILCFHLSWQN